MCVCVIFVHQVGKASQPKRVVIRKGGEDGLKAIRAFVPIKPTTSEGKFLSRN